MFSFIKRKTPVAASGAADEAGPVQAARTRARRRLIGAAVLVGVGIVGFPLLFETQPRPVAVDVPIEIPPRDNVSAPSASASKPGATAAVAPSHPVTEAAPATAAAASVTPRVEAMSPPAPAERQAAPASRPAPSAEQLNEARRAQALLEGRPVPAPAPLAEGPSAARYVVQAGAYSDAAALRDARQKVEKLGLKTYTQVIETDSGTRTRVRVGPFPTRDEAEKAAARIKSAGLAVSVLSL